MRRYFIVFGLILLIGMTACGGDTKSGSASTAEAYYQALVDKEQEQMLSLSCADWEESAATEYDAFQAVTVRLDGLSCSDTGTDGEKTLVTCQGKIMATYNGEEQAFPLDKRTVEVVQVQGEWRVCGYR